MENFTRFFAIASVATMLIGGGFVAACLGDDTVSTGVLNQVGGVLTVSETENANWNTDASGTMGLTKIGAGTLTLSSTNTYTRGITVNSGTLKANNSNAYIINIPNNALYNPGVITQCGSAAVVVPGCFNITGGAIGIGTSNSTLSSTACVTLSGTLAPALAYSISGSGTATLVSNSYIHNSAPVNTVVTLSGSGYYINAATGTLSFSTSVPPDITVLNSGTLQLSPALNSGIYTTNISGSDISNGSLSLSGGTSLVGAISGTGRTLILGSGALEKSSINADTLTIGAGATLTIAVIPGDPVLGSLPLTAVDPAESTPEPNVLVLLAIAALGFVAKKMASGRISPRSR